jgi:hypothetical protein
MINEIIHVVKTRQGEIRLALAEGHATSFDAYQRLVGEYQGLQWMVDTLDVKLAERE